MYNHALDNTARPCCFMGRLLDVLLRKPSFHFRCAQASSSERIFC
jgi:hypothetical protein